MIVDYQFKNISKVQKHNKKIFLININFYNPYTKPHDITYINYNCEFKINKSESIFL